MMPHFSPRSRERLKTCHPDLQRLFESVIEDRDCSVLEGHRDPERQEMLFRTGKSKVKKGKHNNVPSDAVDVAPYPIDWNDTVRFVEFGQFVVARAKELDIPIRWGGDWDGDGDRSDQSFDDLVHFERKI
jgi:peptidoglycan L-alanyl-D-glutamate endopeptidase CwlK